MTEQLRYVSGEEIRKGDRVLCDEHPGTIDFAAADPDDPDLGWYVQDMGAGVMIIDDEIGAMYTSAVDELKFVARGKQ